MNSVELVDMYFRFQIFWWFLLTFNEHASQISCSLQIMLCNNIEWVYTVWWDKVRNKSKVYVQKDVYVMLMLIEVCLMMIQLYDLLNYAYREG